MAGCAGPGGVRTPFDSLADDQPTFPGGPGRVPNVRTHVYPIAEITPFVELNEFEKTLHDLLKAGGASGDEAKLAFHEKTGVLVARAPEKVQELIQELLRALARNSADKREPDREWALMQVKLDSLVRQLAQTEQEVLRLGKRAEEAEALVQALVRKYESDIRQLKESQSNP